MNYALPRVSFLPVAVLTLVVAGNWGCREAIKPSQTQTPATSFAAIAAGGVHTCALTTSGAAYCWGFNGTGRLGDGSTNDSPVPVPVAGGLVFADIAAGGGHTCALTRSGAAYCWGNNFDGQLGNGDTMSSSVPVPVSGGLSFTALTMSYNSTCALTSSGAAYCWGNDLPGYASRTYNTAFSAVPLPVSGGLSFAALAQSSDGSTCGVTAFGAAYCWGFNGSGQLGDSSTADAVVPVAVVGGHTFSSLGAGALHVCGITVSGAAYCWGANSGGILGDGSTTPAYKLVPVLVAGGLSFSRVVGGLASTCGLTTSAAAYCWGSNWYGQLGDTLAASQSVPMAVAGGHSFSAISAGLWHVCALSHGTAYCWGNNEYGQLGNDSAIYKVYSALPVPIRLP